MRHCSYGHRFIHTLYAQRERERERFCRMHTRGPRTGGTILPSSILELLFGRFGLPGGWRERESEREMSDYSIQYTYA